MSYRRYSIISPQGRAIETVRLVYIAISCHYLGVYSNRNQIRRSASSIQFFQQACGGSVAILIAEIVGFAHLWLSAVCEHVHRRHVDIKSARSHAPHKVSIFFIR